MNIVLKKGNNMHIEFMETSGGKSVYTTSDKSVQEALERNAGFNKMFVLSSERKVEEAGNPKTDSKPESPKETVSVTDLSDARDKLSDKTGISRTSIGRTKEEIEELAKANNLTLKWI